MQFISQKSCWSGSVMLSDTLRFPFFYKDIPLLLSIGRLTLSNWEKGAVLVKCHAEIWLDVNQLACVGSITPLLSIHFGAGNEQNGRVLVRWVDVQAYWLVRREVALSVRQRNDKELRPVQFDGALGGDNFARRVAPTGRLLKTVPTGCRLNAH